MYVHAYVLLCDGMGSIQLLGYVVNRNPTAFIRYSRPRRTKVANTAVYLSAEIQFFCPPVGIFRT